MIKGLVNVEDHEVEATVLAFAYHFCLMSCYYIIQPLRDALGAKDVDKLPGLFMFSLVLMIVANPIFTSLVKRYPPTRFIPWVYRFFLVNLIVFYALLVGVGGTKVANAFFLWVGIFNLFAISVFWGFVANLFDTAQGKRLYGFIGAGGTAGQLVGSGLTYFLAPHLGPLNMLLFSMVLLEASVWMVRRMSAMSIAAEKRSQEEHPKEERKKGSALDGLNAVLASPYLKGICLYMFLYSFTSSFLYFGRAGAVAANVTDDGGAASIFAGSNLAVGLATLAIQLFLTGRLMAALGVVFALTLVPIWTVAGFSALALIPSLTVYVLFDVTRKTLNYAVARPARELLYTVVTRDEKYASKSFIDTFVYRVGDSLAAVAYAAVSKKILPPQPEGQKHPDELLVTAGKMLAATAIPFALVWLFFGWWLGRRQQRMAAEKDVTAAEAK